MTWNDRISAIIALGTWFLLSWRLLSWAHRHQ